MKLNIVFAYCTEQYPKGFSANNKKISLVAESLAIAGCSVTVINNPKFNDNESGAHVVRGVRIIDIRGKSSFMHRCKELDKYLKSLYDKNSLNILIYSCGSFQDHLAMFYISKRKNFKIGYIYQEWHWGLDKSFKGKLNSLLNDFVLIRNVDFVLPISEFLISKCYGKKYFKLPIVAEYGNVALNDSSHTPYFLYCASYAYKDVINFILNSYGQYQGNSKLILIINGSQENLDELSNNIHNLPNSSNVELLSKLPYEQLFKLFSGARLLLIPLKQNDIPEVARFSQKTAEYLSTARPILTTNVGEMKYYFRDKVNALVIDYDTEQLADCFQWSDDNLKCLDEIGLKGFEFAKDNFDVHIITQRFIEFLKGL